MFITPLNQNLEMFRFWRKTHKHLENSNPLIVEKQGGLSRRVMSINPPHGTVQRVRAKASWGRSGVGRCFVIALKIEMQLNANGIQRVTWKRYFFTYNIACDCTDACTSALDLPAHHVQTGPMCSRTHDTSRSYRQGEHFFLAFCFASSTDRY